MNLNTDTSVTELHKELRQYWESLKLADMQQMQGEIKNILRHGRAGFIRGNDGEDYYFKISSFQGPRNQLEPGQLVTFYVVKNPDTSKKDEAVHIKPLKLAS